ncbi:MAG: hypothetical protein JNJ46_28330 [Myxococcales bacterium]|nr:hypothetical protein [Myxococcales bacterium]
MSAPAVSTATMSRRFTLTLPVGHWRHLLNELQTMEREHSVYGTVPVEKVIERTRAGEQLLVWLRCQVDDIERLSAGRPDTETHARELPLLRPAAKYLLTTCDRLRRAALCRAFQLLGDGDATRKSALLADAKLWDGLMRDLLRQHGVQHPLSELVAPLPFSEGDLARLGLPCEQLLNGQDLLAS